MTDLLIRFEVLSLLLLPRPHPDPHALLAHHRSNQSAFQQ